jgi:hypothetical protein
MYGTKIGKVLVVAMKTINMNVVLVGILGGLKGLMLNGPNNPHRQRRPRRDHQSD